MSDALPPTTSEPAPFQPIDFGTWESTPEAARIQDPLQKIQAYDNRLRKDLFAAGMYDAEAEAEITAAGADQALRQGLIASPEEYAPVAKPRDPGFLARQLTRKGDSAKAQDIYRYQSFLSRPDTDPETLERARLAAQLDPETENELVRSAVRSGELPFAVVPDKDGNPVFEIDPELGALDRQQILDLAGDNVDPRFLPDLEKQLTRVTGTNYTPAQFRQAAVFDSFLKRQAAEDPFLGDVLQRAQTEYDRTGRLSEETTGELDRTLAALDADNEFAPATRARLIRDTIKRGSKPEAYDPENPQQHIQYLADGTVWLPEQVIFDQAKHDALLDSLDITPEQREAAKKLRAGRLDAIAPSMVDAMGADPDALEFFEKSKAAGKTDAEIATEWYSKPENYGSFSNRARSFGMSLIEAGPGLVQSVAALAGSDSAREALAARAQDTARNEEYARLFGDSYGVGQSLLNTSSQVAADLLAGLAVSAVATPVAGAAVAGSRTAASSLVRGLARTALTEGARSTAAGFLRSATGSAARTLATMGDDVATNLARSIAAQTGVAASSFTRSAGSAYVQAYSALDAQTNAQGQPLYSDAEKRKIALGTAMTAGTATAAITLGFGKLLGPGVEGLVTGKLGTSALRRLFGATDDQIISATRESALAILKSAGQEAPEEAVDQLVGNVIQAVGTGEEFRLGPALKEALEAGLVGGLLGAGTKSIELGVDKFRSPKVEALEKASAPATAAALEAATKAQAEAPAAQPTVINQDGLRIQDNPPLSPDPFTYGEENPDAPNPVLEPSAPPVYEPGDLSAGYGDEPAVGITDTGGAVRVSAAEIEGQIDAVDVQLADLKVVPANETEGQKARRTRRVQELNAEKVRLKAAVKNAKASGGFVFLNTTSTTAEQAALTAEAEVAALDEEIAALSVAPAKETKAAAAKREASLEKVRAARAAAAAVAQTRRAAAPIPRGAEPQSDPRALDYGDSGELTVQDNALGGPARPARAVREPRETDLDYGDGGELTVQDNTLGGTASVPADIIGTDQAPEPPDVEAVSEPGDQELDYGDGGELTVQDNALGGPAPAPAPKPQTTKATKFSRKARALVERMLTPEARIQPPEYLQQQKSFTPTQTRIQSRIAALYEALPVDDSANPEVVQAYQNLVTEVVAQYRAMLATGIKIEMGSENPYATSGDMIDDVERGRLWIYKTEPGSYGSDAMLNAANHPMLAPTEFTDLNGEPMLANDVFRAVHDYVAHAAFGFSFGPLGEEAAWKAHLSTLRDPLARRALTTETRGQNSWVNYRPEMVRNGMPIKKGEPGYIAPQDRPFATQKFALLPEEAMTLVPIQTPTPTTAKKPTEKQLAADVRQGKPLAVHQSLFDDTISQGWVPTRNVLLNQLKTAGFGGQVYGTAFSETVQARIRELYPLVAVPKTAVSKTLKSLGLGDIKVGNKLVSIPVNPDGTTAPFTNDPQTTAWQKNAGLSIKVPTGVTVNPAIEVNPKTGFVDFAIDQTGRAIAGRGDVKRPGSVVGDYEAFQNKTPFGVSLMTLPPPDFSTLPRPVDFAGYTIKPGETTEDDLLRYFVVAPTPGGQSRLEQAIESRAPKNFTSVQKEAVRSAAQLSFIREIREFMMGVNAAGNVDAAGFGHKTTQSYKKYLQDRAATVWSQAGKAKDGTVDTSTHWNERGRPSHLSFFVDTAIKAHADGASRRTDANVQLGSDDVDQETALERAAARNEAGDAGDTLVALDEAFTPEVLRGAAALIGTTDLMDTASGIQILVERLDSVPALRKAFEQAYVGSLDLPPGPSARRALAIMQAKQMDAADLVVVAARAALVQPGVLQAVREAGFFKSLSYGLNTFTDAEVEQHRADNRAAIADLQLDGDLRSALERIARSAKYPRRYRAIMLAALKMPVLPSLAIIDAPTEAYAGSYTHSGRLITLNIASSNGRGLLDVLAHELLHAATIDAVANPQTRAARELRDRLERARQKAADVVPADMAYAVSSLDEFITHAATDPRLQVILRETFERGKSTWQRVVEAIARFFGIANNDFVSDLWGFINHAAEYGYRVGVAASREQKSMPGTDWTRRDAEYLAAVEAGDMATAQRMVDAAARDAGYATGPTWHGTSSGNDFTVFRQSDEAERANIGFHFGSKEQAIFRVNGDSGQKNGRFFQSYLQGRMVRMPDLGGFDPDAVATWMEKDKGWVTPEFTEIVNARLENVESGSDIAAIFEDLIYPEFTKRGFSGIVYSNVIEGEGDSYAVFSPSQIKSADPVTYDDAGNVIPLSARFRPSSPDIRYSPASRRNQLRVRLTREALTNMALEQAEWKDWYTTHQDTLDEFFGDHSGMFQSILAATSQAATVKSNVALALRAFGQWLRGEAFEGFLPAVKMNLERLRNEVQLEGQKISAYRAANEGDSDQVVVDRHIARLLFGVETPSRAQFQKATTVLTQIAERLGWKPSQVQAALWAASIVKSGKTPESYADYLRKLEAKSEVGSRIGAPVAGSPGIDGAGGDRGRFAPRGAQASGRDGGDSGSVDQHLPTLPEGLAYAYDEARPRYLAYARRSQPGTVTINRAALASLVEGLDPANARAIVRKIVNHEIAHLAAFQAFTDAELDEMAAALSTSELADIARKYYGTPDSMQRMAADLASGTLTRAALVEEWLRSVAELVTDGGTTEEAIAFHSANPGMVARILRYIRDYVRALWTRVAGPKEDFATRVSINRLMREYRDIKRGHMPPVAEPFDTSDPYRDNKRAALAPADTDPEATVLSDIMRRETFIDFAGAYTAPAEGWRGTLKQILQTRTGDPRFEAVKNERTGRLNAANQLLANRQKAMSKAIKAEKPDRDLVNRALGDSSPTIPTAVRKQLRADYESAVGEIRAFYNEQAQDANADLEQIARDEKVALREAYAEYDKLRRDALVETARAKKTAISAAMEELRAVAPQTAAAVKKFRSGIDSLSKVMRDTHPEDSYLHAVIDENLGVYLTRTYRAHHGDGDPLAILNSKDPADMETVAAAEKLFVDTIVEGRAEEIVEEEAENDRYISFDEALELARAWAAENELGRRALEDYIASHGSRAFYHGGGNFKIDLTRYMQKVDVPEALRKVLGEVNDPVENAARTFANVAHMAANFRFIEDLARGGKASGALVTKAQKDGFADMVREPDEDAYLQQTIDYGFARRKPAAGYVKVAEDIYHPAWLIEARANRDFQMLDTYEPLATTSAKYGAGSLDGLFAAPLVKALYENSMPKPPTLESEKMVHRFGSFFAKATGASLGIATVTNPAFHARNALGGTLFLGANGINPFAGFGTVSQHFADLVAGKDNPEVTKRIALGIYSDDIRPQAIKELIKDEIDKPGDKSGFEWFGSLIGGKKGERIGELVATGALKLTDVASAIDSVLKGRAYEAELETLRKAYPDGSKTESELERMAAGIVKRTMQSRSMTVPIAEDVTRSSFGRLFAPFLRFKAEMFRITHGTVSQALDEIKSGNPVLRARGYQRMSGFVLVAAASLAGPALISALMGVGEEEEIALREALPPYLRGNSMVYVASGGSITSLDLTFVNPYSMIFDPVSRSARALLRGEADKAPGELASWLHGQFLEEQIAAGAVLEVLNNRTSDNKPITLETDGFGDQVVKYSKHLLGSAYTPQVAKIVDRAIEAQRRGVPEDAEFFETPAGVLSTAIVPARPRTYEASELALRAFKSKAQTLRDIRTKQGRLKIRQNLDAQDVNEIVLDQFESISSLYEDLGRIARGYEGLGLTKAQVIKEMVNAGHSREKARGVVAAGYVPAPSLTPATKRDIFDAGQEVDKNGGGERRVRLVVEAQRALPRVIEIDGAEGED